MYSIRLKQFRFQLHYPSSVCTITQIAGFCVFSLHSPRFQFTLVKISVYLSLRFQFTLFVTISVYIIAQNSIYIPSNFSLHSFKFQFIPSNASLYSFKFQFTFLQISVHISQRFHLEISISKKCKLKFLRSVN